MQVILKRLKGTDDTVGSRLNLFQLGYLLIGQYDVVCSHFGECTDNSPDTLNICTDVQLWFGRNDKGQNNTGNRTMDTRLQEKIPDNHTDN